MSKRFIDGTVFQEMVFAAAERLSANVQHVNALNVFPVPDGDTGTNMNLTLTSGVDELKRRPSDRIGTASEVLAKGLLMGARGNSGVILSQLFRGFSKGVAAAEHIDAAQFAQALQQGVETAYAAVVRPVEGTILTVSKEAAKAAAHSAKRNKEIDTVMRDTLAGAKEALARTPEQLPVLKQVGVVDSGGQGLVYVYEGFLAALTGEVAALSAPAPGKTDYSVIPPETIERAKRESVAMKPAQAHLDAETIEHGYCTEFIVRLGTDGKAEAFQEREFIRKLEEMGDSLLVVADEDLVKVHIHAEEPGTVMNYVMKFGGLTRIKIENMREQHSHILVHNYDTAEVADDEDEASLVGAAEERKRHAFIAVAAGQGINDIFTSLGVDYVLSGGQTMNPSTEDILKAIEALNAEHVFVLPNNSNIILAAGQAKELSERDVTVIPTKSIQQGIAAVLAFHEGAESETNARLMEAAAKRVKSGQVTHAVRDTSIEGVDIREGDHMGILDGKIIVSEPDLYATCEKLLESLLDDGEEVLCVLLGEGSDKAVTERLASFVRNRYPEVEIEILEGNQPVYSYLFSAE